MLRTMVWMLGAAGLFYLSYRMAAWHVFWQVALVTFTLLWAIVGLVLVRNADRNRATSGNPRAGELAAMRASAERARYVQQFGESSALEIDRVDPRFWQRMTERREHAK